MHLHQTTASHGDGWVETVGEIDFPDFIAHAKQAGYCGSMSVEYCWRDVPWERAESAHRYLAELLRDK